MQSVLWGIFFVFVLGMLTLDLLVLNREAHIIRHRQATIWVLFCITLALLFNVFIYFIYEYHWFGMGIGPGQAIDGEHAALMFFTGWLIEQSLSLDNVFVIAVIFAYFGIPLQHQHRVLFWGILGALVFRGLVIGAGTALVRSVDWVNYIFGALLLYTAFKMAQSGVEHPALDKNPLVRLAKRVYPVTTELDGQNFFTLKNGVRTMTPLFLALLVVETTDILFAFDSVPAVFAITQDPFIVYTSNIFAILNLRSLYFTLALVLKKFRYVKTSLIVILAFVGCKLMLHSLVKIPIGLSLVVISLCLAIGFLASVMVKKPDETQSPDA